MISSDFLRWAALALYSLGFGTIIASFIFPFTHGLHPLIQGAVLGFPASSLFSIFYFLYSKMVLRQRLLEKTVPKN